MVIIKREKACPFCTSSLWWLPTVTYIIGKSCGMTYHNEWIWWVTIPTLVLGWVLLNWKIKK
jgi:hypothetical protein